MSAPGALLRVAQAAPGGPSAGHVVGDDLVFVGAGASTSYTLLSLLDGLAQAPRDAPVRIRVVERDGEAFPGLPYGSRAARTSLLITSLHDFLPDGERGLFAAWLSANKSWIFDEFCAAGGPIARQWWTRHAAEIEREDFDALFLPRYTFGTFLRERTLAAVARAEASGAATTCVVAAEVRAITRDGPDWSLDCGDNDLRARRIVLATGSPPAMPRLTPWAERTGAVLVDDPFDHMPTTLELVRDGLRRRPPGRPAHVVLVGGNASTMDVLYLIGDLTGRDVPKPIFTVVSPQALPARIPAAQHPVEFAAERLAELEQGGEPGAADIYHAAVADIARAEQQGLSPAVTITPISRAVGRLLPRLSPAEAAEFAGRWGAQLGRRQRRAGWEYWEVVDALTAEGRLRQRRGWFTGLGTDGEGRVFVRCQRDGIVTELPTPADVIVNCAGPAGDLRRSAPPLLTQLIADGVCAVTPFGAGLAVGPTFEAAPGLHVMGPLLAGNVLDSGPLWHMEHCGRISASGTRLGRELARQLVPA